MPKVSAYELEHISEESSFEKVRKKSKMSKESKRPDKKKHREKKIDYYEILEENVTEGE